MQILGAFSVPWLVGVMLLLTFSYIGHLDEYGILAIVIGAGGFSMWLVEEMREHTESQSYPEEEKAVDTKY